MDNEITREIKITDTISVTIKQSINTDIATAHSEMILISKIAKAVESVDKVPREFKRRGSRVGSITDVDAFINEYKNATSNERHLLAEKYNLTIKQLTQKFWYLKSKGTGIRNSALFKKSDTALFERMIKNNSKINYDKLAKKYGKTKKQIYDKIKNLKNQLRRQGKWN